MRRFRHHRPPGSFMMYSSIKLIDQAAVDYLELLAAAPSFSV